MLKLKIDDAAYTTLKTGPVISVIYRLNGVKVSGEDLEVRVCDFIEAKKEEWREHERDIARLRNSDNSQNTTPKKDNGVKNMLGNGFLKVGGHN